MTANHSPDAAVDDADLVRYLDGELDGRERARVEHAVAHDPSLAARLEQLRGRSARLSALLEGTDPELAAEGNARRTRGAGGKIIELNAAWAAQQGMPARMVPPPRPVPGWLRAAAIIAVLLGGSLFVPPVRAWIVDLFQARTEPGEDTIGVPGSVPLVPVDTFGIGFESAATAFVIEFTSAPAAGSLTVEWLAVDSVTAERYSAGGNEEFMRMSEGLLRVRNGAASTARYRIGLPARAVNVTVRVPGRAEVRWQANGGRRTLDLQPGGS
ncbi:MAG: zf-HC2 domain-containing protein [Gemmatimonadota bacterium]|jgi:anti-sigma factor RsiW